MTSNLMASIYHYMQINLGKMPDAIIMHHQDYFKLIAEMGNPVGFTKEGESVRFIGIKIIRTGDVKVGFYELMSRSKL